MVSVGKVYRINTNMSSNIFSNKLTKEELKWVKKNTDFYIRAIPMKLNDFWKEDMRITRKKLKQQGIKVRSLKQSKLSLIEYLDMKKIERR
jgi:hypothetical protein